MGPLGVPEMMVIFVLALVLFGPKKLPETLTKEEVKKILGTIQNVKHKLLLGLMYSSGLRVSEAVNCKVKDLDFEGKLMRVRQAKGAKDRMTILSEKVCFILLIQADPQAKL